VFQSCQQRDGVQQLHASRRELEGEREIVEPRTDLTHRLVKFDVMPDGSCALDEEGRRVPARKRVNRVLVLGREVERNAACDDEPEARGTCEQVR
jgi:hypothetical protein